MDATPRSKFPRKARLAASSGAEYCVIDTIGQGGNASAYLAIVEHGKLAGCVVALKVLDDFRSRTRFAQFVDEVSTLLSLDHPAIIRIYDHGFIGISTKNARFVTEHPFYAMPFYKMTLSDFMRAETSMYSKLAIAVQLCSALAEVHCDDAVHRDIKPSNIFVSDDECALGDFGLLRRRAGVDYSPGAMARHYPTPELLMHAEGGEPPSVSSDVFQLGVVLWELFAKQKVITVDEGSIVVKRLPALAGAVGRSIAGPLAEMLVLDPAARITARDAAVQLGVILRDYLNRRVAEVGRAI